jgi:UDP-N-acetylmuramate dehydrogenase
VPNLSIRVQEQVLLAPFTTFRIGGPASFFCEVASEAELVEAVEFARQHGLKIFILGGGSNLLVGDDGFDGLVIRIIIDNPVKPVGPFHDGRFVNYNAAAGTDWNAFVLRVCEQGISGVECLAGIPGSVGGTPVQNVGAYGQEVASTITAVRAFDLEADAFVALAHDQCGFAYRHSIFNTSQRGRYVVTAVSFRFDLDARPNLGYADLQRHFADWDAMRPAPTPLDVYHAVRAIRHRKGMLIVEGEADCRSAGSFFKNPVVPPATLDRIAADLQLPVGDIPHWPAADGQIKLPAAWLLEKAGFTKGFALGQAGISSRHTLALINRGHAMAADILALRDRISSEVLSRFGIRLEQEPVQPSSDAV